MDAECLFERWYLQDNIFLRTNSLVGEQSCSVFSILLMKRRWTFLAFIKRNKPRGHESNHTCTCLCSHSGAMGDCGIRGPVGIDLGSTDFSGQAGRIHKKKHHSPWGSLGFPPLLLHSIRYNPSMCLCAHFQCGIKERGSLRTEAGFVEGVSHAASKRALTYKFTITHPHRDPEMSDF